MVEARYAAGACKAALRKPNPHALMAKVACSHVAWVNGSPLICSRQARASSSKACKEGE